MNIPSATISIHLGNYAYRCSFFPCVMNLMFSHRGQILTEDGRSTQKDNQRGPTAFAVLSDGTLNFIVAKWFASDHNMRVHPR
jgi:hypothetical protein